MVGVIKYGIQLFSVRDEINSLGLDEVLRMIKEAGYDYVELAGYYGLTPEELAEKLASHGLIPLCAHIATSQIEASLSHIDALGIKKVFIPSPPVSITTDEGFRTTVDEIKKAKATLDARGVKLGYHNHEWEFQGGTDRVFELMKEIPGLTSQLDIFWVRAAGISPTEVMKKYGGLLDCLHVKDINPAWDGSKRASAYPCAIIGEGIAECEAAIALGVDMGIDTFILEVEGFPCDVFEYLKKSCENMKKFASKEK